MFNGIFEFDAIALRAPLARKMGGAAKPGGRGCGCRAVTICTQMLGPAGPQLAMPGSWRGAGDGTKAAQQRALWNAEGGERDPTIRSVLHARQDLGDQLILLGADRERLIEIRHRGEQQSETAGAPTDGPQVSGDGVAA